MKSEVVLVSAYGRGESLASDLVCRGLSVSLLDLSAALGDRLLPDLEGPFPIVRPNPLLPSHLEWLMLQDFPEIPNGLSIWLKNGPIELRGDLATFFNRKYPFLEVYRDVFEKNEKLDPALPFDDSWLVHFAASFANHNLRSATEFPIGTESFPLHQSLQIPLLQSDRFAKTKQDLKALGVQVIDANSISDAKVEFRKLVSVTIETKSELNLEGQYWVWMLTTEETQSLSRAVAEKLFPQVIPADWAWRRFQMHGRRSILVEIVPPYAILLKDIHFPWVSDNLVILKRRTPELSDVWVRLPHQASTDQEQIHKFSEKLKNGLQERFPHDAFELEIPWIGGSPLYPLFETASLKKFEAPIYRNLIFEGAEVLPRLDWSGRFQVQTKTLVKLQNLRAQDTKQDSKKDKPSDQEIHAP